MNDYAKLKWWSKLLRSGDVALAAVSRNMANEALTLIDEGFEKQQDPYGQPWAPKQRPDGRRILHGPTGRLRRWRRTTATKRRFMVEPRVDYATAHQAPGTANGRLRRPRRRMVPSGRVRLPLRWRLRLTRTAIRAMSTHFKRRQ